MTFAIVIAAVVAITAIAVACRKPSALDRQLLLSRLENAMPRNGSEETVPDPDEVAALAEEIARAIEQAVCEPGEQCANRACPDCIRYEQAQADAATARRIGSAS